MVLINTEYKVICYDALKSVRNNIIRTKLMDKGDHDPLTHQTENRVH